MKRIAIVSDIHGNMPALEQVVKDIESRNADAVFNLGDHISGPLWPKETIDFLMQQDWVQIAGNHDRQLYQQEPGAMGASDKFARGFLTDKELDWLRALPGSATLADEFFLFHGSPGDDLLYLLETIEQGVPRLAAADEIKSRLGNKAFPGVLICGHTHIPRVVTVENNLIINPGSVGLQAYDDVKPEYHKMEVGSPHARYVMIEKRNGEWSAEIIALPYDYKKAAERAAENGRPDWDIALRTGFLHN